MPTTMSWIPTTVEDWPNPTTENLKEIGKNFKHSDQKMEFSAKNWFSVKVKFIKFWDSPWVQKQLSVLWNLFGGIFELKP